MQHASSKSCRSAPHTSVKFPKEARPVLFCYARLVILIGQDVGIREAAKIVGICSRGKSFYRQKHSKIQV